MSAATLAEGVQGLVFDGPLILAGLVAVAAGLLSFFSPCCLPLVPGYVSYIAGRTAPGGTQGRAATIGLSLCFVLGFSTIFIALGASATALGQALAWTQGPVAVLVEHLRPVQQGPVHRPTARQLDQFRRADVAQQIFHARRIVRGQRTALLDGRLPIRLQLLHGLGECVIQILIRWLFQALQCRFDGQ